MRRSISHRLLLAALAIVGVSAGYADAADIKIGIRQDAEPFSYRQENGDPSGFMAGICVQATKKFEGLGVEYVNVLAKDRFKALEDGRIDVLCDPATITEQRIENLVFSGPVYLSGISYAVLSKENFPKTRHCGPVVGLVAGTTSEATGLQKIIETGDIPRFGEAILSGLSANFGEIECPEKKSGAEGAQARQTPIRLYDSHDKLAKDFCAGDIVYYVGDIEIVSKKMKSIPGCTFRMASGTFKDERYAFFGDVRGRAAETQLAIYGMFNEINRLVYNPNSPYAIEQFKQTFQGDVMSSKLKVFFWSLTGVEEFQ